MKIRNIEPQEYLPLILSAVGTLGILPFAVMRLSQGEWLIGAIDSLIVVSLASLGIFVFRTQKIRAASIYLSILVVIGALTTVYVKGPMQVYWTYPALLVCFYILKPKEALLLVSLAIIALYPALASSVPTNTLAAILVTLGITVSFAYSFATQNIQQQNQLLGQATRDSLTGAGNRRAFKEEVNRVIASKNRAAIPCSLLMIDLDRFKSINDKYGHAVGDETLKSVCDVIRARIRQTDGLFRVGGEEFVVIANNDHINDAHKLAESLRRDIETNVTIPNIETTVSVGVAELVSRESRSSWLRRADKALYQAKREGRNRVSIAPFPKKIKLEADQSTSTTLRY